MAKFPRIDQRLRRRDVDAHFLIMGYPSVEHYRHVASNLGLDGWVTFTGKVPYEQAPRYLALGDVAVAPKISATEGSGKILNYMAMALPTVAFDTPVAREYLGINGMLAERVDAASVATAVRRLCQPGAYERVCVNLRESAEQRTMRRFLKHIVARALQ